MIAATRASLNLINLTQRAFEVTQYRTTQIAKNALSCVKISLTSSYSLVATACAKASKASLFVASRFIAITCYVSDLSWFTRGYDPLFFQGLSDLCDLHSSFKHSHPQDLAFCFKALIHAGLFTTANKSAIKAHENQTNLLSVISLFSPIFMINHFSPSKLSQTILNRLFERAFLSSNEVINAFFDHIPHYLLNEAVIERLYELSAQQNPLDHIIAFRNHLLGAIDLATPDAINVHHGERDDQTLIALNKLYATQPPLSSQVIEDAYSALIERINNLDDEKKDKALRALNRPRVQGADFGPLVSDSSFTIHGSQINGKELIARLWRFASGLQDPKDQENAKSGIISALVDSINNQDHIVCDQGKTQRLVCAVLQGRLEGVNIEGHDLGHISKADAMTMFFLKEARRAIATLDELLQEAIQFCAENPAVKKDAFLQEIRDFAEQNEIV